MRTNGVYVGRDGWLFLLGGSNDAETLFTKHDAIPKEAIVRWQSLISERRKKITALGAKFVHCVVPDKLAVYPEYLNEDLTLVHPTPTRRVFGAEFDEVFVDLLSAMLNAKGSRHLYWKTDTHWTFDGACVALAAICAAVNAQLPPDLHMRPVSEVALTLDLGSKLTPPVKEVWSAPKISRDAEITYRNPMVRFLDLLAPRFQSEMHVGTSVGFQNSSPTCDPRRVLIFGDSYCEYRPHSLTGLFAETFKEVRFVWSAAVDYALVKEYAPQIVITEMAERFIRRVPDDGLELERINSEKMVRFLNKHCSDAGDARFRMDA